MATKTEPSTLPSEEVKEAEESEELNHLVCFMCTNPSAAFFTTLCGQAVGPEEEAGPDDHPPCKGCIQQSPIHYQMIHA